MKVNIFYRKKNVNQYSIERVYNTLIPFLLPNTSVKVKEMPFVSKGIIKRFLNILYASINQSDINHISGDINYVNFFIKKKSTILTIHDIYPLHRNFGFKKKLLNLFWFKIPIRRANIITTVSEFSKAEILNEFKIPNEKILVINNCVSPLCKPSDKEFNKESPNILHIGTKENKNLNHLIEALKGLNTKLIIVGKLTTVQKNKLNSYKINFDNFKAISDVLLFQLYEECDILSFISLYEGFGLPIIEAQAIGRVVITSNVSSMPEIAGKGAYFVDPYSEMSIKNGIKKLISNSDLRNKLINYGFENIKKYQPEKIAKQYLEVYNKILDEK